MCHILDAKPSPWTLAKTRKEFWFTRQRPLSIPQLRNGKESAGRKWRFKGWSNIKLTFTDGWQSAPSESRRASYPHCPRMQKWAHHPPSAGVTHHGPLSLSALNPCFKRTLQEKGWGAEKRRRKQTWRPGIRQSCVRTNFSLIGRKLSWPTISVALDCKCGLESLRMS